MKIEPRKGGMPDENRGGGSSSGTNKEGELCPLLIVHGENDRQVPLSEAQKLFDAAVNSPGKKLKVFTLDEGGAEHCQVDNNAMGVDHMADWVAEVLGGSPKGV